MKKNLQLGIIGENISHSLSPKIHIFSAKTLGLQCSYDLFNLKTRELEGFLKTFWDRGGVGLNVTSPHKERVAELLESPLSSVNTLVRGTNKWVCHSTDGEGFSRAVSRLSKSPECYRKIVIIGSGGVVTAILKHLSYNNKLQDVTIFRRNKSRDRILQNCSSQKIEFFDLNPVLFAEVLRVSGPDCLLVQASSAIMNGDHLDDLIPALEGFHGDVIDLAYGHHSRFIHRAQNLGLKTQDGLPMLVEQAMLCQSLWWGKSSKFVAIMDELTNKGTLQHFHKDL